MQIQDFKFRNQDDIFEVHNYMGAGYTLPLLKYKRLEEISFIDHCFTTREGGSSADIFATMNLSYTRGDEKSCVDENYDRLAKAFSLSRENFVCSDQTHTTNVRRVGKADWGNGVTKPRPYTDVDGLITNEPDTILSTFYADCVPLYFVDPVHKAIGLSHSGWRGTVGRMGMRTLEAMQREFGTDSKDVIAAIGPSICQDCYEISEDVAVEFYKEFAEHENEILIDKGHGKYQLNLWRCNEIVLLEAGIQPENLLVTNLCTCCNPKLLFSHRASQGKRGNLGAFLVLRNS